MNKLWQLKKLSTGAALSDPQPLPENWGPIFGLHGIKDKLGDLSWLGSLYSDQGWFEVGDGAPTPIPSTPEQLAWARAKQLLAESDWSMLPDVPMSSGDKARWIKYRADLRDIRLHPDFPNMNWPERPE